MSMPEAALTSAQRDIPTDGYPEGEYPTWEAAYVDLQKWAKSSGFAIRKRNHQPVERDRKLGRKEVVTLVCTREGRFISQKKDDLHPRKRGNGREGCQFKFNVTHVCQTDQPWLLVPVQVMHRTANNTIHKGDPGSCSAPVHRRQAISAQKRVEIMAALAALDSPGKILARELSLDKDFPLKKADLANMAQQVRSFVPEFQFLSTSGMAGAGRPVDIMSSEIQAMTDGVMAGGITSQPDLLLKTVTMSEQEIYSD